MRENAGLSLDEAAPRLYKTRSALGRIENAETRADVHLVRSMMDLYDHFDPDLVDLAWQSVQPGWWRAHGIEDRGFVDMETEACTSQVFQAVLVPGLLQTEGYVRALFSTRLDRERTERDIAVRLVRQERLTDTEAPLALHAIIDEAALRRPVGGREVMREQLRHLVRMAEVVTIQVLSLAGGVYPAMGTTMTLLSFPEDEDPDLLHVEHPVGALQIEKVAEVARARLVFEQLEAAALSPEESVELIERVIAETWEGPCS